MTDTGAPAQQALLEAINSLTPQIQELILLISDAQAVPQGAAARIEELIEALNRIGSALATTSGQLGDLLETHLPLIDERMMAFEAAQGKQSLALKEIGDRLTQLWEWFREEG